MSRRLDPPRSVAHSLIDHSRCPFSTVKPPPTNPHYTHSSPTGTCLARCWLLDLCSGICFSRRLAQLLPYRVSTGRSYSRGCDAKRSNAGGKLTGLRTTCTGRLRVSCSLTLLGQLLDCAQPLISLSGIDNVVRLLSLSLIRELFTTSTLAVHLPASPWVDFIDWLSVSISTSNTALLLSRISPQTTSFAESHASKALAPN